MTIAEVVKKTRQRERLSQADMARGLGVTRQTVHQWEKGEAPPGLSLLLITALDYRDWRRDFALAALDAHPILQERYRITQKGRQILEESDSGDVEGASHRD